MPPKRYAVFYHIWAPAGTDIWRLLVDEQCKRLEKTGLRYNADVFCCITGPQCNDIRNFVATYDWIKILVTTPDEGHFEGETLVRLHQACTEQPNLEAVAYIHTKGIRHLPGGSPQGIRAINTWRHFLEWGTIDRWREAIAHLQTVDAVGVNFRDSPWPHFSGNFWWATANYIRTLVSPVRGYMAAERSIDADDVTLERTNYERWIGLKNPKIFSFFDFPFYIPHREWTYGFNLYVDDIYPIYERIGG